jgi:hypothetical protein
MSLPRREGPPRRRVVCDVSGVVIAVVDDGE